MIRLPLHLLVWWVLWIRVESKRFGLGWPFVTPKAPPRPADDNVSRTLPARQNQTTTEERWAKQVQYVPESLLPDRVQITTYVWELEDDEEED